MKEEGKVKISLGITICIIIICILAVVIGVLLYYIGSREKTESSNSIGETEKLANQNVIVVDKDTSKNNVEVNETKVVDKNEKTTVVKIDNSKEWVYDIKNPNDNIIPLINVDSKDIEMINKEIAEKYKDVKEEDGDFGMEYKYFVNDKIVSLVIKRKFPNDVVYYSTYNINLTSGKNISNLELVHSKDILETEYLKKIESLYKEETDEYYSIMKKNKMEINESGESFNSELKNASCSINAPMYLDENGKVNVVVRVPSIAGAAEYQRIINTDL
ncbi:MAG: hypothetical protein IKG56_03485 [Clostridia bacterium]|nr:hypothetical protein [Clostridia bacterium]